MKVVIPGGSGHVGQSLSKFFAERGAEVVVISRSAGVRWDGKTLGDWAQELEEADAVINLAGRSVNCRYTAANRKEMWDSRIESTKIVGEAIAACKTPPKVWLQASTATIYSHRFDAPNDDIDGKLSSTDYGMPERWMMSVELAKAWEQTLEDAATPNTRKVAMRSAMVMAPIPGSVFSVFCHLAGLGLLGRMGSGRQFVSWIHELDFCRSVEWLIQHESLRGPVILASPNPVPQEEFAKTIREAMGVKIALPATELMLKMGTFLAGSEAELVLKSRRVVPTRLLQDGFQFKYPDWPSACAELLRAG